MAGQIALFLFLVTLFLGPAIFAFLAIYYTLRYVKTRELHMAIGAYARSVYYRSI